MAKKKINRTTTDVDYVKELESYVDYLETQLENAKSMIKQMQPIYLKYTNQLLNSEKRAEVKEGRIIIHDQKHPFWE